MNRKANNRAVIFGGGAEGIWEIKRIRAAIGAELPSAERLTICSESQLPSHCNWMLAGVPSHVRYVERKEKIALQAIQAPLGRPETTCAALIPIQKSAAWWDLTQEERR